MLILISLFTANANTKIKVSFQGCDCLGYIKYFDAHFTNFTGGVETIENCVCMHEEDHGILWKHQDWRTGLAEVRRSRRLTVSFICTVANYEYGFFWHFYQVGWHLYNHDKPFVRSISMKQMQIMLKQNPLILGSRKHFYV